jgi:hypothetical protein
MHQGEPKYEELLFWPDYGLLCKAMRTLELELPVLHKLPWFSNEPQSFSATFSFISGSQ